MQALSEIGIVCDLREAETAQRIGAGLAERSIKARIYPTDTGTWASDSPEAAAREEGFPRLPVVVLLESDHFQLRNAVVIDRGSSEFIVADITSGAIPEIPEGIRALVHMQDFDAGLAELAFHVEKALGFTPDSLPSTTEPTPAPPAAPIRVTVAHSDSGNGIANRLRVDLRSFRPFDILWNTLDLDRVSRFTDVVDTPDLLLWIVARPYDMALLNPRAAPEVWVLATSASASAVGSDSASARIDFSDYATGLRSLLAMLERRYGLRPDHPLVEQVQASEPGGPDAPAGQVQAAAHSQPGEPPPSPEPQPWVGTQVGAGNDRVAKVDALGFRHYVRAFVDLIESSHTRPPLTIGVYGSWGMGKSFLLEHVIARLKENRQERAAAAKSQPMKPLDEPRTPDVYVVSFNAWEYSATEVIWPGLVRKIMDTMEREVSGGRIRLKRSKLRRNFVRRLKDEAPRVVVTGVVLGAILGSVLLGSGFNLKTAALTFSAVGLVGLGKVLVDTLNAPLSQWVTALFQDTDYGKQIGHMAEIRDDLELLETLLREENGRMVVVIDDLDRCEPEKAVEMLQAINLLLNFESFIVVMGIDARIVTRAIEKHYTHLLGPAGASGYEYLDKIVQIPFRIPNSEPDTIRTFLQAQLGVVEAPALIQQAPAPEGDGNRLPQSATPSPEPASNEVAAQRGIWDRVWVTDKNEVVSRSRTKPASPPAEPEPPTEALPPPPAAFSPDEHAAFEAAAPYLKPNPRHIKRLVNVYRLVRALAHLRQEETILQNPAATLRWLITSGQWPYAAHAMLTHFADMEERGEALPNGDPLPVLLERVSGVLNAPAATQLDHDYDVLHALLKSGYGVATSEQLKVIRRYTVNFNPAVERELFASVGAQPTDESGEIESAANAKSAAPKTRRRRGARADAEAASPDEAPDGQTRRKRVKAPALADGDAPIVPPPN
jgi:Cdc6-like AAA superfamily ATPase